MVAAMGVGIRNVAALEAMIKPLVNFGEAYARHQRMTWLWANRRAPGAWTAPPPRAIFSYEPHFAARRAGSVLHGNDHNKRLYRVQRTETYEQEVYAEDWQSAAAAALSRPFDWELAGAASLDVDLVICPDCGNPIHPGDGHDVGEHP